MDFLLHLDVREVLFGTRVCVDQCVKCCIHTHTVFTVSSFLAVVAVIGVAGLMSFAVLKKQVINGPLISAIVILVNYLE